MSGVAIVNAHHLQAVDLNFFVVQLAHAGRNQWPVILGIPVELVVVAGDVIDPVRDHRWRVRRCQLDPGLRQLFKITGGSVVQIAGKENDVRLESGKYSYHAPDEPAVSYVTEMRVADQSSCAASPMFRQVWQGNLDARYPQPGRVDHTIGAGSGGCGEQNRRNRPRRPAKPEQSVGADNNPAQHGRPEEITS